MSEGDLYCYVKSIFLTFFLPSASSFNLGDIPITINSQKMRDNFATILHYFSRFYSLWLVPNAFVCPGNKDVNIECVGQCESFTVTNLLKFSLQKNNDLFLHSYKNVFPKFYVVRAGCLCFSILFKKVRMHSHWRLNEIRLLEGCLLYYM